MLHPAPKPQNLELNYELLNLDYAGRGHRPDGKFMSNHGMELIAAHQDEIEGGLSQYQDDKGAADRSVTPEKLQGLINGVDQKATNLEAQLTAHKPESVKVETSWQTTQDHLSNVYNTVLQKTADLEQQLTITDAKKTVLTAEESAAKKGDFTEEYQRELQEIIKLEQQLGIEPADVVESDESGDSLATTQELPVVENSTNNQQQEKEKDGRFRVSIKKVSNRLTHLMQKSYTAIDTRITNYFNDEAGGGDRAERRKNAAAIGFVLGSAAIVLGMKYGVDLDLGKDGGGQQAPASEMPQVDIMPSDTTEATHQLSAGDSVWSQSVDYANSLGYDTNDVVVIDAIKDEVLRINNFADPNTLPVGTEIRMPSPAEIEEILKQYEK